jgi:5'-3' exoribonuclease 1
LHFSYRDDDAMTAMAENYVLGLQWVLLYYYRGVPSWSWFYRYHYSPKITGMVVCDSCSCEDIRRGLKVNMTFDLAQPFKPFEQLMGVLPSRSRKLLPEAYRVCLV